MPPRASRVQRKLMARDHSGGIPFRGVIAMKTNRQILLSTLASLLLFGGLGIIMLQMG